MGACCREMFLVNEYLNWVHLFCYALLFTWKSKKKRLPQVPGQRHSGKRAFIKTSQNSSPSALGKHSGTPSATLGKEFF
jgi:hypothetical protein